MMRSRDPRIRQRINQISHNIESANESAQEGLYTFSQNYLSPCFTSIGNCIHTCTAPCFPTREDQIRRRRRGQAEANFDFYDDWDNAEEDDTLLGWGTGELDRLLAGSGLTRATAEQPRRPRRMSYGTRNTRRRSTVHIPDNRSDPTVIPSSSLIGFLERFPWRFGAKGVKYRPSAADLQEHPGSSRRYAHEDEPLMEDTEEDGGRISYHENGRRNRSGTGSSRGTSNSLSSRGDLFPSDDEEDAVPLDDEFALAFGRRGTGLESDDQGSKSEMVRSASGTSSLGDASSKKSRRKKKKKRSSTKSPASMEDIAADFERPSLVDLKVEENQAALDEESAIKRKRLAAQELAAKRGLDPENIHISVSPSNAQEHVSSTQHLLPTIEPQPLDHLDQRSIGSSIRRFSGDQTEPFPPFPLPESPDTSKPSSLNRPGSALDLAEEPSHNDTDDASSRANP